MNKNDVITQAEIDFILSGGKVGECYEKSGNWSVCKNESSHTDEFSGLHIIKNDFSFQSPETKEMKNKIKEVGERVAKSVSYNLSKDFSEGISLKCIWCASLALGDFLRCLPSPAFLYFEQLDIGGFFVEIGENIARSMLKQNEDNKLEKAMLEKLNEFFVQKFADTFAKEIEKDTDLKPKLLHTEMILNPEAYPLDKFDSGNPFVQSKDEVGLLLTFETKVGSESKMVNLQICRNLLETLQENGAFRDTSGR